MLIDVKNKKQVPFLALTAAFVWGLPYPFIKIGMEQFHIAAEDTGGKTLYAGIRFFIAGFIVLFMALQSKRNFRVEKKDYKLILLFAFINTALHYFCFYIGVSNSYGSRASILNTMGTFIVVFLACAIFKDEHLTIKKIMGCVVGFLGVIFLNLGGGDSGAFTLMGDGMIILNAVCSAFGSILTRIVTKKTDPLVATGYSLSIGGFMLIIAGVAMGGGRYTITILGVLMLLILVAISVIGFSIYNQLVTYHPVGNVAIYNSMIPVFAVITSCLFLGEPFLSQYVLAIILVVAGVVIINK